MKRLRYPVACVGLVLLAATAPAGDEKLQHKTYTSYFESNRSGLTGPESFLVIGDRKKFDDTFGVATVQGKKPNVLAPEAFNDHLVLAVVHRGNAPWRYRVDGVTDKDGTLTFRYRSEQQGGGGAARFASPLIVSVPKGKYTSAVFVENGRKVATVPVEK